MPPVFVDLWAKWESKQQAQAEQEQLELESPRELFLDALEQDLSCSSTTQQEDKADSGEEAVVESWEELATSAPERGSGPRINMGKLRKEFQDRLQSAGYQKMLKERQQLPAHTFRRQILDAVSSSQVCSHSSWPAHALKVCVIAGETGCGKTTQVPQFLLEHEMQRSGGSPFKIVCTEPRRISAVRSNICI